MAGVLLSSLLAGIVQIQVACAAPTESTPSFGNPVVTILKLVLSLGLIAFLAVGLIRWLSKRSQVAQKGAVQVVAARQLAPNKSIQVVDVQGRVFVLGVGDDVTLLADLSNGLAVETGRTAPDSDTQPFGAMLAESLQSLRDRHKGAADEERTTL